MLSICCYYGIKKKKKKKKKKNPKWISIIKSFIEQYEWTEIDLLSYQKICKKFESNKKSVVINISFVAHNTGEKKHSYKSQNNFKRENQIIPLVITDGRKCHYLAVTKLPALLRGIPPKHEGDF